ncbi:MULTISPECIES: hypothetical protein [unclassified Amycolatopsis]|uniref:hypothetical protein n=1 Tax=unclassified Amycolatopsis TaxID=2618356 RepID=UPI002E2021D0|nr:MULTISPECIES: hypothetical protein [unclassified Amycolatopsis]
MRNGSDDATSGDTKARGPRTVLLALAIVAAGFGVSQAHPGNAPAGHSVTDAVVSAGGGSGEGPNR